MTFCQKCGKELETELDDFDIETANCIFHFCLDCNSKIEDMIEKKIKYSYTGEKR